ncbi:MAG: hypothetical protein PWQ88_1249 [Candidatus Methanomethylophilaceae archaeon]|nr:hypothetical protein [Candidatus Methanomethylophilaceae archaeon]MDI3541186.1 hypothetical protein [Candidatus Methanomethylophilaceae archaeon]HIJ00937.1 Toprim subdomain protein [Candidatus Methanomethylophilaceae archaeon]
MGASAERFEKLVKVLKDLEDLPPNYVILVEGVKDRAALGILGIDRDIRTIQGSGGMLQVAEQLKKEGRHAVILTDWDRTGGQLSRLLKEALSSNQVKYDDDIRARLSRISRKDIKDVESLPALYSHLATENVRRREQ